MILINRYKRHETKFQGCWCAFAFHKEAFDPCIDFMEQSTLKLKNKKQDIKSTKIFGGKKEGRRAFQFRDNIHAFY